MSTRKGVSRRHHRCHEKYDRSWICDGVKEATLFPCDIGRIDERPYSEECMNFLEQLASEWYEYQGYFVRRNIKFGGSAGKSTGGHSGEIDILAFHPKSDSLIHIETSSDFDSWEERKEKFVKKKFTALATAEYQKFIGRPIRFVERVAIVSHSRKPNNLDWQTADGCEIKVMDIPTLIHDILIVIRKKRHARDVAIPEQLPLLRAMHYAVSYGDFSK